jgi:Ion channel
MFRRSAGTHGTCYFNRGVNAFTLMYCERWDCAAMQPDEYPRRGGSLDGAPEYPGFRKDYAPSVEAMLLDAMLAGNTRLRESALTLLLIFEGVSVFVTLPLAAMHALPLSVVGALNGLIVLAVLIVTSSDRRAQAIVVACALADIVCTAWWSSEPTMVSTAIDQISRIVLFCVLTAVLVGPVFRDDTEGTYHRVLGGVAIYMNVALIFAFLYRIAAMLDSHAFTHMTPGSDALNQSVYFSFATLTTTGYGDIAPLNPLVRSAANVESLIGTLFPATLLARLVVRYFA